MPKRLQKELEKIKKQILPLEPWWRNESEWPSRPSRPGMSDLAEEIIKKDYEIDEAGSGSGRRMPEDPGAPPACGRGSSVSSSR